MNRLNTHFLLARDIHQPSPSSAHPALPLAHVDTPAHPAFPRMLQISSEQGLDEPWCREQLDGGAHCFLALDDDRAVGMGLVTASAFWVEEILHTIDPTPRGCYFFATYVAPTHRGRGIQRQLDQARVDWAASRNLDFAYALVESTNIPSLRSHRSSGFAPCVRIDQLVLPRFSLFSLRPLSRVFPTPRFAHTGFPPWQRLHLVRNARRVRIADQ